MKGTTAVESSSEYSQTTGTDPGESSPQQAHGRAERILNGLLAAVITAYGILMALVISAASSAEGLYFDNVFIAQAELTDASELSIEAQIGILYDLSVMQQLQMHEFSGSDPAIIEFFYGQLSAEAQASVERSGGLDDAYVEEVYAAHNVGRERAMGSFNLAGAWSERAGMYETLTTVLAVGLAFAAWASLMGKAGSIRWMFAIIATLILLASIGFLGIHLATREPLAEYVAFAVVG